jgi:hypothetical protein
MIFIRIVNIPAFLPLREPKIIFMKTVIILIASIAITASTISQNVGVGTATPNAKLEIRHLSGSGSPTLLLYDNGPSNFARLQFQNASGSKYWHVAGYIDDITNANSRLNFFHSNYGDVMGLTGDGKVGIGTQTPSEKLSVVTGLGYGISHSVGSQKLSTYIDNGGVWLGSVSNDPLFFYTNNGTAQLSLLQNGNIGIGTNGPVEKLDVSGNIKANNFLYSSPITDYYSISGADFRSVLSSEESSAMNSVPGTYMTNGNSGIVVSVYLPHGAIVTGLTAYVYDNATNNLTVSLFWSDHLIIENEIASITTSGTPGNTLLTDNTISSAGTIDNTTRSYYILARQTSGTWVDFNLRVSRIQIDYTIAKPD